MLAERGVEVTCKAIRRWGLKFGREFANRIRRRSPRRGDNGNLGEVVSTIPGSEHWLWRAVDQESFALGRARAELAREYGGQMLIAQTAEKVGKCAACSDHRQPKSYAAAKRGVVPRVEHSDTMASIIERTIPTNRRDDGSGS
jgi:putative transposase